mgnify:CR=1 FL=1
MPTVATTLVTEVICPNCWERFRPERIRYVAAHRDLVDDIRLGPGVKRRFLPSRFHPDGRAIDPNGGLCSDMACPRCHLGVPRMLLESPTVFVSSFGAPGSGKSYFLAAMTHRLRQVMPREFALNFSDADPEANAILHADEDSLFGGVGDRWVSLRKTDVTGDRYRMVDINGESIRYPSPFYFQVSPVGGHPGERRAADLARTLCLYDNAGESFEPGADREGNPVTQHLARSGCLLFVYDPLQETDFRRRLADVDKDASQASVTRQDVLLAEVARRIRFHHGLGPTDRHSCPLVVVVTKFDAWRSLVGGRTLPDPWVKTGGVSHFRGDLVDKVSKLTRDLLLKHAPSIIATAESFVAPADILYVPVSATGSAPTLGPDGRWQHATGALSPMWVEVPLLYALSRRVPGLVPGAEAHRETNHCQP